MGPHVPALNPEAKRVGKSRSASAQVTIEIIPKLGKWYS